MADEDYTLTPEAPEFAFDPTDPWTQTFQRGLELAGLGGRRVYEVGIGTGINAAFMLRMCNAARVSGSDLDPRLVELAERNVRALVPEKIRQFKPVRGAVSLIDTEEARAEIAETDVVIACLPQVGDPDCDRFGAFREEMRVPLAAGADVRAEDHIAHYYPWAMFDDYPFNTVGLGLNEALLSRLVEQAPDCEVVMNFGCRIGTGILFEMFEAHGYKPEKLHSQMALQHAGTDISFFVTLERALKGTGMEGGFVCEFFADEAGKQPLSAIEAQARMDADPEAGIYHEVCVIKGVPAG
ncbi:class I SAM-dependent methyltransferase [Pelagovum pacificum]|uniref:Class I SAM-dependent methyltransferase n=2 Tax=Pelagovum pacificum TaxID=2588711 RepID=A0A5C5GI28_9RHOB|nr:class I SAM-dependent methyltransferase [Pelagovum pacificum]